MQHRRPSLTGPTRAAVRRGHAQSPPRPTTRQRTRPRPTVAHEWRTARTRGSWPPTKLLPTRLAAGPQRARRAIPPKWLQPRTARSPRAPAQRPRPGLWPPQQRTRPRLSKHPTASPAGTGRDTAATASTGSSSDRSSTCLPAARDPDHAPCPVPAAQHDCRARSCRRHHDRWRTSAELVAAPPARPMQLANACGHAPRLRGPLQSA